jgi:hypothetical protein
MHTKEASKDDKRMDDDTHDGWLLAQASGLEIQSEARPKVERASRSTVGGSAIAGDPALGAAQHMVE